MIKETAVAGAIAVTDVTKAAQYIGSRTWDVLPPLFIAAGIYLLRSGKSKVDVRDYLSQMYDLNFTLDEIRPSYRFEVSCQKSVPQAINAFLEAEDFADTLKNALSIGGDADTLAAMAGSLAEACYPIPMDLEERAWAKLTPDLQAVVHRANEFLS